MSKENQRGVPVAMGAAVAVFGVAVAGFVAMQPSEPTVAEVQVQVPAPPQPDRAVRPEPPPAPTVPGPAPTVPGPDETGSAPGPGTGSRNRLARDLQREQIWRSLARKHALEPAGPGSAAPTEEAAAALPRLDEDYLREAIREQLVPAAIDCYEAVLERDRELAGQLMVEFTIIGDEEVGGVVDEVNLTDESTIADEFLRECVKESMLAVTFEPPPEGGRVEVDYPLRFSPDEPED